MRVFLVEVFERQKLGNGSPVSLKQLWAKQPSSSECASRSRMVVTLERKNLLVRLNRHGEAILSGGRASEVLLTVRGKRVARTLINTPNR